ncbi:tetrahydrofolate synthase [Ciborinia camelliae]|nr:tetrahydrofolate synthase [Ciborinia camelliae]
MSSKFWSSSYFSEGETSEEERQPESNAKTRHHREKRDKVPSGPWNTPLTPKERARRANLSEKERNEEAEAAREAYDHAQEDFTQSSWYKEPQASPPVNPAAGGNPTFFQGAGAFEKKTGKKVKQAQKAAEKQRRQEQKAAERERRQEARREAEEVAREEQKRFASLDRWAYIQLWRAQDRAAHGAAFDDFAATAADFIQDNGKEFPRLAKHGCDRANCVTGELLGVCHHEVEVTLRGSGCLDEKMVKKERLRWHPDRWTGKGELQRKSNELFQLIQRIIDGDANAKK